MARKEIRRLVPIEKGLLDTPKKQILLGFAIGKRGFFSKASAIAFLSYRT